MVKLEASMENTIAVRRAVDQLLGGTLEPLLDLLADEVELEVADGEDLAGNHTESGKAAVADYFTGLGGLPAFWQMDYTAAGEQVIAWGTERFTLDGCGLEGACEFALVFEIEDGAITRLLMVEDLRAFVRATASAPSTRLPINLGDPPRRLGPVHRRRHLAIG
jgi:ketosteroid isomerase-like protein